MHSISVGGEALSFKGQNGSSFYNIYIKLMMVNFKIEF
jgi:hypothetical protein